MLINFLALFGNKKKVNFKSNEILIIPNNQQLLDEEIGKLSGMKRSESKSSLNNDSNITHNNKIHKKSNSTTNIKINKNPNNKPIYKPSRVSNIETVWIPLFGAWGFVEHRKK